MRNSTAKSWGMSISTRGWVGDLELLGLGPIGVMPACSATASAPRSMNETVARANAAGERGIALLGSPDYYSRFGFVPSRRSGVERRRRQAGATNFQLLPLAVWPGGVHGTFRYAGPFGLIRLATGYH